MKKYACRLIVAVLTFFIGTGITYLNSWDKDPFRTSHSSENNSPYSILEGRTVRIKPYDATFDIPESWLTPNTAPSPSKNLHLSQHD